VLTSPKRLWRLADENKSSEVCVVLVESIITLAFEFVTPQFAEDGLYSVDDEKGSSETKFQNNQKKKVRSEDESKINDVFALPYGSGQLNKRKKDIFNEYKLQYITRLSILSKKISLKQTFKPLVVKKQPISSSSLTPSSNLIVFTSPIFSSTPPPTTQQLVFFFFLIIVLSCLIYDLLIGHINHWAIFNYSTTTQSKSNSDPYTPKAKELN
jgi:hypothetical protein